MESVSTEQNSTGLSEFEDGDDSRLLSVLLTVARDMNSEKDVDRLLDYMPGVVAEMADAERCTIFLTDKEQGELWSRVATGQPEEIRIKLGQGIAGHVASTGETLNIDDVYSDSRFSPDVDRSTGFKTRNLLCAPLRNLQGDVLGVFQLLNKKSGSFTRRDEEFLSLFGSHAAVAIEGARLNRENRTAISELTVAQDKLTRQMSLIEALYSIEQEINKSGDFASILSSVIDMSAEALGAEAGSILLTNEGEEGRLYFHYSSGEKSEDLRELSISSEEGFAGWVMANRKPLMSNSPREDERFHSAVTEDLQFDVRNLLAAPLMSGGELLGVLEILNRTEGDFDDQDLVTLEFIASQISGTLNRKLLAEESQKAQRLASVGNMASRVIHDFKNPMTVIKGITQLFQEDDLAPEKRDKYCRMMLGEIDRCVEMTQEILDFARGDSTYRLCVVRLDEMLDEVIMLLERDCVTQGIPMKVDIPKDLPVNADPQRLKRVFFNLCRNSLEAMKDGGEFSLSARKLEDGGVEIRVADRGPGISQEIADRLWEPFATFGKPNGTGLGLAICKSVVEGHGGTIALDENHSPGACFVITFPSPEGKQSPA